VIGAGPNHSVGAFTRAPNGVVSQAVYLAGGAFKKAVFIVAIVGAVLSIFGQERSVLGVGDFRGVEPERAERHRVDWALISHAFSGGRAHDKGTGWDQDHRLEWFRFAV
jgi:hypothetical protein